MGLHYGLAGATGGATTKGGFPRGVLKDGDNTHADLFDQVAEPLNIRSRWDILADPV
jgi:hypothetical protein